MNCGYFFIAIYFSRESRLYQEVTLINYVKLELNSKHLLYNQTRFIQPSWMMDDGSSVKTGEMSSFDKLTSTDSRFQRINLKCL